MAVNDTYTKGDLIDAIVAARTSYLPWAYILAQEIDRLTVELVTLDLNTSGGQYPHNYLSIKDEHLTNKENE